jgi:hypothetical protein
MEQNNTFSHDLAYGKSEEKFIHELFSEDGEIKIEVKSDRKAQFTGNVYIEYESRKKPSGISTTQSDYYIFKFFFGLVLGVPIKVLKNFCKQLPNNKKGIIGGDKDENGVGTSLGCLVKVKDLVDFSLKVWK